MVAVRLVPAVPERFSTSLTGFCFAPTFSLQLDLRRFSLSESS